MKKIEIQQQIKEKTRKKSINLFVLMFMNLIASS